MNTPCATLEPVTDLAPPRPSPGGVPDPGLTADELAAATAGRLLARSSRLVLGAAVDSREVVSGNLFVALPGQRTDGHRFIGDAIATGAAAVVVARPPEDPIPAGSDVTVVQVDDALRGLHPTPLSQVPHQRSPPGQKTPNPSPQRGGVGVLQRRPAVSY